MSGLVKFKGTVLGAMGSWKLSQVSENNPWSCIHKWKIQVLLQVKMNLYELWLSLLLLKGSYTYHLSTGVLSTVLCYLHHSYRFWMEWQRAWLTTAPFKKGTQDTPLIGKAVWRLLKRQYPLLIRTWTATVLARDCTPIAHNIVWRVSSMITVMDSGNSVKGSPWRYRVNP